MDLQKMFGLGGIFSGINGLKGGAPDGTAPEQSGMPMGGLLQALQNGGAGGQGLLQMLQNKQRTPVQPQGVTRQPMPSPMPPSMMRFFPNGGGQ